MELMKNTWPERIVGQRCHTFLCPALENACPVCDLGQSVDHAERLLLCADGSRRPLLSRAPAIRHRRPPQRSQRPQPRTLLPGWFSIARLGWLG